MVIAALDDLGWFDSGRRHAPINLVTLPTTEAESVPFNSLSISTEDQRSLEAGLGNEIDDIHVMWVDFFAENTQIGQHLIGDIHDIVLGKMASIERVAPIVDVYDLRDATPWVFTVVDIESVGLDRFDGLPRPWQENWMMLHCNLVDEHLDDYVGATPTTTWGEDFSDAWQRVQAVLDD
jgi:hypothetical protein